jgi:hypothetical protein
MATNKFSKRTYDCTANYDNASVQGTSQPHNRSYGFHDNLNAKRRKSNTLNILNMPDSYKGPWSPLKVLEHPKTTWNSGTEPFPMSFGALHPPGIIFFPASMSNVSESSWSQDLSENSYTLGSDSVKSRGQNCSSWKGMSPTTGPYTIRSSPSTTVADDVDFTFNRSIDVSRHAATVSTHKDQDATRVTENADWFCGLGLGNNWSGSSANATSNDISGRGIHEQLLSSETLLETRDTQREHSKRYKTWNKTDQENSRACYSRQVEQRLLVL